MRGAMTIMTLFAGIALTGDRAPVKPVEARAAFGADVPLLDRAEEVVSYKMKATLDPTLHTVHGEGTIQWRNTSSRPVNELWFHLYLNAFKNQRSVFMREPVGGFRGNILPKEWGTIDIRSLRLEVDRNTTVDVWKDAETKRPHDDDETDVRVPLPKPVLPGYEITLEAVWDDKLPSVVERTGFDGTFHMVAQWFPKIAKLESDGTFAHFPFHHLAEFYADYGRYDVTIDVPAGYTIGATGPTLDAAPADKKPGRRVERHYQNNVHDFAWTAWDKFESRREDIAGVAVEILFPPGYGGHAERELATIRFALPHYGERYGKYPYEVLTLVHPPSTVPEAGGMEYPTLITTGGSWATPNGVYLPELVTIHEFGHQYFYGLIATNEVAWPFLDEGLNSFAEAQAMAQWKGKGSFTSFLGLSIGDAEGHAERARHFTHDDRVAQPAFTFGTGNAYGSIVYSRTATILETMRRVYGDDKVGRALGVYARRFRFKHPTPSDLIETFNWEIGTEAAETLRSALFDKGWVDYTITAMSSFAVHDAAGIFDVAGKRETVPADKTKPGKYEGWVLVTRRGTLSFPVQVELVAADGKRTRVDWDGASESTRIPYAGDSPLRAAIVDPDSRVLLDQDPTNDYATAPGQSAAGVSRVTERATWWAEVLGGALGP
jgi:hypothetical protein